MTTTCLLMFIFLKKKEKKKKRNSPKLILSGPFQRFILEKIWTVQEVNHNSSFHREPVGHVRCNKVSYPKTHHCEVSQRLNLTSNVLVIGPLSLSGTAYLKHEKVYIQVYLRFSVVIHWLHFMLSTVYQKKTT